MYDFIGFDLEHLLFQDQRELATSLLHWTDVLLETTGNSVSLINILSLHNIIKLSVSFQEVNCVLRPYYYLLTTMYLL